MATVTSFHNEHSHFLLYFWISFTYHPSPSFYHIRLPFSLSDTVSQTSLYYLHLQSHYINWISILLVTFLFKFSLDVSIQPTPCGLQSNILYQCYPLLSPHCPSFPHNSHYVAVQPTFYLSILHLLPTATPSSLIYSSLCSSSTLQSASIPL